MRGAICDFIERATPYKACCEAGNGIAAIAKARERAPRLVVLDLGMPMLYGIETASTLREIVPDTKIISLAMFDGEFRKSHLAAAGFDMILSKQEGLAKLAEAINKLLPASPENQPSVVDCSAWTANPQPSPLLPNCNQGARDGMLEARKLQPSVGAARFAEYATPQNEKGGGFTNHRLPALANLSEFRSGCWCCWPQNRRSRG